MNWYKIIKIASEIDVENPTESVPVVLPDKPDNTQHAYTTRFSQKIPKVLQPLVLEARKYNTWEEFEKAYLGQIKHGIYWHLTDNPNFTIDPLKGPRDMSSMAIGKNIDVGKLMITSHLENWLGYGKRQWAAQIDMSDVDPKDFWQVNRGFGNEFFINDPSKAKVIRVVPLKNALAIDRYYDKLIPQNEEELIDFFYKSREQQ
jgi:hypothetical protein